MHGQRRMSGELLSFCNAAMSAGASQWTAVHTITTHFYSFLPSVNSTEWKSTFSEVYKRAWEEELGQQIPDDLWDDRLHCIHTCSINARNCLIQFKVLCRLYYLKSFRTRIRVRKAARRDASAAIMRRRVAKHVLPIFDTRRTDPCNTMRCRWGR